MIMTVSPATGPMLRTFLMKKGWHIYLTHCITKIIAYTLMKLYCNQLLVYIWISLQTPQTPGAQVLDKAAMMFCARKVSAVAGDMRKALDICRRSVELAQLSSRKSDLLKIKGGSMTCSQYQFISHSLVGYLWQLWFVRTAFSVCVHGGFLMFCWRVVYCSHGFFPGFPGSTFCPSFIRRPSSY